MNRQRIDTVSRQRKKSINQPRKRGRVYYTYLNSPPLDGAILAPHNRLLPLGQPSTAQLHKTKPSSSRLYLTASHSRLVPPIPTRNSHAKPASYPLSNYPHRHATMMISTRDQVRSPPQKNFSRANKGERRSEPWIVEVNHPTTLFSLGTRYAPAPQQNIKGANKREKTQ